MLGAILKATNSSFQGGIIFCRSIHVYMKKVMKLLAFIFEQPSYLTCKTVRINKIIKLLKN